MKRAYIFLADGFETIEALTPYDVLFRCGIDVKTVSISDSLEVTSSHKISVRANMILADNNLNDGDAVILPGGYPGYVNLCDNAKIGAIVKQYYESGKIVAAICAAPTVLAKNGIATGKEITCHHSVREQMKDYKLTDTPTTKSANLITGIGAGRSLDFAFAIAAELVDEAIIAKVRHGMEL